MASVFDRLAEYRVVPTSVAGLNFSNAHAVADALIAGGLPVLEITLRTPEALPVAASLAKRGDILISTGTILTLDQARASLDAGVAYMVAPGLDLKIVEWASDKGIPLLPGATTATEITHAYNAGLRVVKFFPCEIAGGVAAIKLFAGPFQDLKFVPTGGITTETLRTYLACPHVLAAGRGSIVTPKMISEGRYAEIEAAAREMHDLVRSLKLK